MSLKNTSTSIISTHAQKRSRDEQSKDSSVIGSPMPSISSPVLKVSSPKPPATKKTYIQVNMCCNFILHIINMNIDFLGNI